LPVPAAIAAFVSRSGFPPPVRGAGCRAHTRCADRPSRSAGRKGSGSQRLRRFAREQAGLAPVSFWLRQVTQAGRDAGDVLPASHDIKTFRRTDDKAHFVR
jgi:hypothetical protein